MGSGKSRYPPQRMMTCNPGYPAPGFMMPPVANTGFLPQGFQQGPILQPVQTPLIPTPAQPIPFPVQQPFPVPMPIPQPMPIQQPYPIPQPVPVPVPVAQPVSVPVPVPVSQQPQLVQPLYLATLTPQVVQPPAPISFQQTAQPPILVPIQPQYQQIQTVPRYSQENTIATYWTPFQPSSYQPMLNTNPDMSRTFSEPVNRQPIHPPQKIRIVHIPQRSPDY